MKRFLSLFLCMLLVFPFVPSSMVLAEGSGGFDFIVDQKAKASATVFNSIQDAINAVPVSNTGATPYTIQIKNGVYRENLTLNRNGVILNGESQEGVILTSALPDLLYINDGGYIKFQRGSSTYNAANEYNPTVLTLSGSDCNIQNMTIKLEDYYIDMGPISAITTTTAAQRNTFKLCTLGGGQDTLYDNGRTYYYKCTISGSVDFTYGGASSVFDSCDIKSIYWERLYNLSEIKGLISYGLSANDLITRGITDKDITLWTATDSQRSKYPNIVNGPNRRTADSSKTTDFAATDFTRILTVDELKSLTDAELSSRKIARDSSNNPNGWKTIAEITASDSKRIKSVGSGYLTACSTPQTSLGFLFINCNLIGDARLNQGSYALGRPWRSYAQVSYVNCKMGPHISPTGWNNWGNAANEKTARYEEYGSMNLDGTKYDLSKRFTWAKVLTDVEAVSRNPYNYLKGSDGWDPTNEGIYYSGLQKIADGLPINNTKFVSKDLDLPTNATGAAIKWFSSNTNLISNTGTVNRPAYNADNQDVTLTALIQKDGYGVTKDFNLTVLKASDSDSSKDPDYVACLDAYNALQLSIIPSLNLSAIKNDLTLPTQGINSTTLEWKSYNSCITDSGRVTRPAATATNAVGVLQLTIRKNKAAVAYKLDTTVIKYLNPTENLYTPGDFIGKDVGNPTTTGSSIFNKNTNQFIVTGQGTGFTKNITDPDQFYFDGVLMSGDFSISAKVSNFTASGPTAGLTIRDSLDPLSKHFTQTWQQSNKGRKMYRYNGSASGSNNSITLKDSAYIKLTKSGDDMISVISSAPIPSNPTGSAILVINQAKDTGIGLDSNGNEKEIYTGLVLNGGASATFQDVKIVSASGAVIFDSNAKQITTAPAITITSTTSSGIVYNPSLPINGTVDKACTLTIILNGNPVKFEGNTTNLALLKDGKFSYILNLIEGLNNIEVKAVDAEGRETKKNLSVTYINNSKTSKLKPSDFIGIDIGNPSIKGSSSFNEDTNLFTLTAAGTGINKSAAGPDQIYLEAVKLKGDYTISAKINVVDYTPSFKGSMGLTVRESLDPTSYHYTQTEGYGIPNAGRKMFRYSKGDGTVTSNGSNFNLPLTGSAYLRLTKIGNNIISVISLNPIQENPQSETGVTSVNTVTALDLGLDSSGNAKELYAGLVLYSNDATHAISATFENVKIVMSDGTVVFDANDGKPIAPKNVSTKPDDKSASISWDILQNASSYTVKQSDSAEGPFVPVKATITSENGRVQAMVSGLQNEKTYYYVVTASNSSGESPATKVCSVIPSASSLIPPVITMNSTTPASIVYKALLPLEGSVDKACTLTIKQNGNLIKLNGDNTSLSLNKNGTFGYKLPLKEGDNNIEIKAVDDYGHEAVVNCKVTYIYRVTNINFYDVNNNVITKLIPGQDVLVKAEVENYIDKSKDSILVVGLYDTENRLVKFIYSGEALPYGEAVVYYAKLSLPQDINGYTMKAFIWDNFDNIHPTSNVVVLK